MNGTGSGKTIQRCVLSTTDRLNYYEQKIDIFETLKKVMFFSCLLSTLPPPSLPPPSLIPPSIQWSE